MAHQSSNPHSRKWLHSKGGLKQEQRSASEACRPPTQPPAHPPACLSPHQKTHTQQAAEGINAYGVTRHRHMPEIEQGLSDAGGGGRGCNGRGPNLPFL